MPYKNLNIGKRFTKLVAVAGDNFSHADGDDSLNVDEVVAIKVFSKRALKISVKRISGWEDIDLAAKQAMSIGVGNASIVNFVNANYASVPRVVLRAKSVGKAVTNSQFVAMDAALDVAEASFAGKFEYLPEVTIVAA